MVTAVDSFGDRLFEWPFVRGSNTAAWGLSQLNHSTKSTLMEDGKPLVLVGLERLQAITKTHMYCKWSFSPSTYNSFHSFGKILGVQNLA